jgi:hypothetical protein
MMRTNGNIMRRIKTLFEEEGFSNAAKPSSRKCEDIKTATISVIRRKSAANRNALFTN